MSHPKFVEKIKTYFTLDNFSPENLAVYEVRWKDMIDPDRSHMKI
jgi:hypothetical protein